jgi:hypothetical protein
MQVAEKANHWRQAEGANELANLMAPVPMGALTVVLDACFSGGMEKLFLTSTGKIEFGKTQSAG